ncbi:GNAT family N-acetyltransferase [Bacillus sp. FJAT-51639]|uniref:GNAT family N-acetyltransferase n=1 Tax=Bacillus bruguierae TaxID=3127667 RepID=A0ABU8FPR1_9BACI
MDFHYVEFNEIPDNKILDRIVKLHTSIFGHANDLITQMKKKPQLRIDAVLDGQKVIAYKIGYALSHEKFYSWLGGVDPDYRNHGVASKLMERQHRFLKEQEYKTVQTKTKNKWRNMLILNIKNGFDVIGTYTDNKGEPKIILEKRL